MDRRVGGSASATRGTGTCHCPLKSRPPAPPRDTMPIALIAFLPGVPAMSHELNRREVLSAGVAAGALTYLGRLPAVAAQEAKLSAEKMTLTDDIAPLVRLIEDTPREKLLEEIASRIKQGTTYQQ